MSPFPSANRPMPAQLREPTAPEFLLPQTLHPRAPLARLTPAPCTRLQRSGRTMPERDATCGEKLLTCSDFPSPLCLEICVSRPAAQLLGSRISEYLTGLGLFFSFFPTPYEKLDENYNLLGVSQAQYYASHLGQNAQTVYLTKTSHWCEKSPRRQVLR